MLPPVLEIFVVWHPADDDEAREVVDQIMAHFHGRLFSGLIGGAIEVFVRSAGWDGSGSPPRRVASETFSRHGLQSADLTVLVPLLGFGLEDAVRSGGAWADYARMLVQQRDDDPEHVMIFPAALDPRAVDATTLSQVFGHMQESFLQLQPGKPDRTCRDLAQAIAQSAAGDDRRLTVFISHTKADGAEERDVARLVASVKSHIDNSKLGVFFDTTDLQLGVDWDATLRMRAANSAMLAIRTDLYASRTWCQREMWIAKCHGMPIVVLDALTSGEERGSFLMDHVPRVSIHREGMLGVDAGIERAMTLLVDESLKRALWQRQERLAAKGGEVPVDWWAPHAPEPITLAHWLLQERRAGFLDGVDTIRVIHPDPPLGSDEREVLDEVGAIAGLTEGVDVMTPAALAARTTSAAEDLLPEDGLNGMRLGCSVSRSDDLARLGFEETHLRLALGEIARVLLVSGGSLAYGGHLGPEGYTQFLVKEVQRYGRKDRPLLITLPASVHEPLSEREVHRFERELGLLGRVLYIGIDGEPAGHGSASLDPREVAQSLTAMRRYQTEIIDGRVLIGGARSGWTGAMPGLVEEATLCLERGRALFLAGGFGGVTLDLAVALGIADEDFVPQEQGFSIDDSAGSAAVAVMLAAVRHQGLGNGLSAEENRQLAMSHRPGEVASLVALGLGRLRQQRPAQMGN